MIFYRPEFGQWRFPTGHRHQFWSFSLGIPEPCYGLDGADHVHASAMFNECETLFKRIMERDGLIRSFRIDFGPGLSVEGKVAKIEAELDEITKDCVTPISGPWEVRHFVHSAQDIHERTEPGTYSERRNLRWVSTVNIRAIADANRDSEGRPEPIGDAGWATSALNLLHGVDPEHFQRIDDFLKANGMKPMEYEPRNRFAVETTDRVDSEGRRWRDIGPPVVYPAYPQGNFQPMVDGPSPTFFNTGDPSFHSYATYNGRPASITPFVRPAMVQGRNFTMPAGPDAELDRTVSELVDRMIEAVSAGRRVEVIDPETRKRSYLAHPLTESPSTPLM